MTTGLFGVFGTMMAVTAIISVISIIVYYIWLFCNKKLHGFQSTLIVTLLACEIGTIVSSVIQFGINLEGLNDLMCSLGLFLFTFFTNGSFLLSSLLVVSLLHLSTLGTRFQSGFLLRLNSERRLQLISVGILVVFDIAYTCMAFFVGRNSCNLATAGYVIYWGLYFACVVFNFSLLGFLLYNLEKVSKVTKERVYVRVIFSVALVVGLVRVPQFLLVVISQQSAQTLLNDPEQVALGVLTIIANSISVLQGFFVVVVVGTNQGMFAWCKCCLKFTYISSYSEKGSHRNSEVHEHKPSSQHLSAHEQELTIVSSA